MLVYPPKLGNQEEMLRWVSVPFEFLRGLRGERYLGSRSSMPSLLQVPSLSPLLYAA